MRSVTLAGGLSKLEQFKEVKRQGLRFGALGFRVLGGLVLEFRVQVFRV